MAITLLSKVESLPSKAQSFGLQTAAFSAQLRSQKITIESAEGTHRRIQGVFQKVMDEVSQIKGQIEGQTTFYNQEQMFELTMQVTASEENLSDTLKLFNNTLLTHCPTAKIPYGDRCIGAKIPPKIDTSNVKVLETLAKASHMREIRGDGNCFFSALSTRLLESLVQEKKIESLVELISNDCIDAPELKNELITTLFDLQDAPSTLENILQDNHKILPFINYFRRLAANEMKEHPDHYEELLLPEIRQSYKEQTQGQSFEKLVDKFVLTMGVDASHPQIEAICRKIDFPVRIIAPSMGVDMVIPEGANPKATFCLNNKHYYVLYTREEAPQKITMPLFQTYQPKVEKTTTPSLTLSPSIRADIQVPKTPLRTTQITVKCDAKPGNDVFIRGSHPLSWDKGAKLRNVNRDTWVYETTQNFQNVEYKILINDNRWEDIGNNHRIDCGKKEEITPRFPN
jgi:hypothetical protein